LRRMRYGAGDCTEYIRGLTVAAAMLSPKAIAWSEQWEKRQ